MDFLHPMWMLSVQYFIREKGGGSRELRVSSVILKNKALNNSEETKMVY